MKTLINTTSLKIPLAISIALFLPPFLGDSIISFPAWIPLIFIYLILFSLKSSVSISKENAQLSYFIGYYLTCIIFLLPCGNAGLLLLRSYITNILIIIFILFVLKSISLDKLMRTFINIMVLSCLSGVITYMICLASIPIANIELLQFKPLSGSGLTFTTYFPLTFASGYLSPLAGVLSPRFLSLFREPGISQAFLASSLAYIINYPLFSRDKSFNFTKLIVYYARPVLLFIGIILTQSSLVPISLLLVFTSYANKHFFLKGKTGVLLEYASLIFIAGLVISIAWATISTESLIYSSFLNNLPFLGSSNYDIIHKLTSDTSSVVDRADSIMSAMRVFGNDLFFINGQGCVELTKSALSTGFSVIMYGGIFPTTVFSLLLLNFSKGSVFERLKKIILGAGFPVLFTGLTSQSILQLPTTIAFLFLTINSGRVPFRDVKPESRLP